MRVSRLISNDWTFGKSMANYVSDSASVRQSVLTRIRSFKNDWFLDVSANIDWFGLLGTKNNESLIENEIRRVVLETDGVVTLTKFELTAISDREAFFAIAFTTIYDDEILLNTGVTI